MAEQVTPSAWTLLLEDVADTRVIHVRCRAASQCAHLAQAVMFRGQRCESLSRPTSRRQMRS
jgi:hypothetical protein